MHRRELSTGRVTGLYPILTDAALAPEDVVAGKRFALFASEIPAAAVTLAALGVRVLQVRLKESLGDADALAVHLAVVDALMAIGWDGCLFVNDRADLAALVAARVTAQHGALAIGVHVGQTDLPPAEVRAIVGPDAPIGLSTHTRAQLAEALADDAVDLVGFGPVFGTQSKADPAPTVGLVGLAAACDLARGAARARPVVAIGGIPHLNVTAVHAAGATAAAVIGDLAGDGLAGLAVRARRLMEAWA